MPPQAVPPSEVPSIFEAGRRPGGARKVHYVKYGGFADRKKHQEGAGRRTAHNLTYSARFQPVFTQAYCCDMCNVLAVY